MREILKGFELAGAILLAYFLHALAEAGKITRGVRSCLPGALFAKDLEFEFEILDYYDPLSPNQEKREWLDNLRIEGVYYKTTAKLEWEKGSSGYGRDAIVIAPSPLPTPGLRTYEKEVYKKASNVVVKDGKVRFKLAKSIPALSDLAGVRINDFHQVEIELGKLDSNAYFKRQTIVERREKIFRGEGSGNAEFNAFLAMSFRLDLVENGELFPVMPGKPIGDGGDPPRWRGFGDKSIDEALYLNRRSMGYNFPYYEKPAAYVGIPHDTITLSLDAFEKGAAFRIQP
jgi:hypothetical protein